MEKMKAPQKNKISGILWGVFSVVFFIGSFALTSLGLLTPLRPYEWAYEPGDSPDGFALKPDEDCAAFIFVTCSAAILLLVISWIMGKFGKAGFFQKEKAITNAVYLIWLIIPAARLIYVFRETHSF